MSFAKFISLISRLFFAAALLLMGVAVFERASNFIGYTILRGALPAGRLFEISATLMIFVIAFLLRQIREDLKKG